MVTAPGLHADCVMSAGDALAGDRHEAVGELFGTTWLSWHWREVLLGTVGGLLVLLGAVRLSRHLQRKARAA